MILGLVGDLLKGPFIGIMMTLDSLVYSLIGSSYKIFMVLAGAKLLTNDTYEIVANRVYMLIGIMMLFVLAFAILKAIVDPDQGIKELGGAIIKRVVIAVIGLAATPVIFNLLYQGQALFLENDVIGKIFFRIDPEEPAPGTDVKADKEMKNIGGSVVATSIWQAFFRPANGMNAQDIKVDKAKLALYIGADLACAIGVGALIALGTITAGLTMLIAGATIVGCLADAYNTGTEMSKTPDELSLEQAYAQTAGGGSFKVYLLFKDNFVEEEEIDYTWFVSTICGLFALYAFVSFSIDMGTRAAKLAYYQIIAPIPLIMQVMPKFKDNFSKYIKNVVSTFLEVFIRVSVVYITVFVVCHLRDVFSGIGSTIGIRELNPAEKALALALLIIGLVLFAKSAPDIICQSLNIEKGSMKLGIGKKLSEGGVFAASAVAAGTAQSAVRGWKNSGENHGRLKRARGLMHGAIHGAWDSMYGQFGPGADRKPAKTWSDAMAVSAKAAKKSDASMIKGEEAYKHLQDAIAAKEATREKVRELEARKANGEAVIDELKAAKEADRKATRVLIEATSAGRVFDESEKRWNSWSVGTIDTTKEKADYEFADKMSKLNDTLRDLAATKGSSETKAAKALWDSLENQSVSDYIWKDGYNQTLYEEQLRNRSADVRSLVSKKPSDLTDDDKNILRNDLGLGADYNFDNLSSLSNTEITSRLSSTLDAESKRSEFEAATLLSDARKQAKDRFEALADIDISLKLAEGDEIFQGKVNDFLSENSDYIKENQDRELVVTLDGNHDPKDTVSVGEMISTVFGSSAVIGGQVDKNIAGQGGIFEIEADNGKGTDIYKAVKKDDGSVEYRCVEAVGDEVDKMGNKVYTDKSGVDPMTPEEFKKKMGMNKKISSVSRISNFSKTGKTIKTSQSNNRQYLEKLARQEKMENSKNNK